MKSNLLDVIVMLIKRLADEEMSHPDPYARLFSASRLVDDRIMQIGIEMTEAKERKTCF
jgi:hypothetical protein